MNRSKLATRAAVATICMCVAVGSGNVLPSLADDGSGLADPSLAQKTQPDPPAPLHVCKTVGKPFIELVNPNGGTGSRWCAEWDDPNLSLVFDSSTAGSTAGNRGTLIKSVTFKSLAPISIRFVQKSDQSAANSFGLRFTMKEFVANQSGSDWAQFVEILDDSSVGGRCFPEAHPPVAHFHNDNLNVSPTKTDGRTTGGFDNSKTSISSTSDDKLNLLVAAGGPGVKQGEAWFPTGIGVHECESNLGRREFTLTEGPLPPPSAVAAGMN